jgi:uncharacterized membrane protein
MVSFHSRHRKLAHHPQSTRHTARAPWEWLGAGWKDLWRAPAASISLWPAVRIMGYILVYLVVTRFQFALALTTGFLLAGPFLAMGLVRHQPPAGSGRTRPLVTP